MGGKVGIPTQGTATGPRLGASDGIPVDSQVGCSDPTLNNGCGPTGAADCGARTGAGTAAVGSELTGEWVG